MLFKKPKWLRPELDEPKYWLHLAVILGVIYGLMNLYDPTQLSTAPMLLVWLLYLAAGDTVAHTLLKLD